MDGTGNDDNGDDVDTSGNDDDDDDGDVDAFDNDDDADANGHDDDVDANGHDDDDDVNGDNGNGADVIEDVGGLDNISYDGVGVNEDYSEYGKVKDEDGVDISFDGVGGIDHCGGKGGISNTPWFDGIFAGTSFDSKRELLTIPNSRIMFFHHQP
ncbi:hypothetical protein AALP_AA2G163200 [Arabis alpina]|uniref:Uncharacterized protein n=1 Tax=Arabis alpina TaxID=50452 RepID=A0A087HHV7_ARAAL|nr:hypothetical protein AALP_AA2G163200 [Arabis alpina]